MATFLDIQTSVRRNVIDLPSTVSSAVPGLINSAMRTIQEKHNFKVMETLLSATTVVATRILIVTPSNWKEPRNEPSRVDNNTGFRTRLFWVSSRDDFIGQFNGLDDLDDGSPMYILESEPNDSGTRNIEVWPLPDGNSDYGDGEYRLSIPYWRYLPALVADGDTNWLTNNAAQYLEFEATQQAFAIDWDEERMALWAQKAQLELAKVVLTDKMYRLASINTLVPYYKGANSPRVRW